MIEPCFGIGHSLSLIRQLTSEDIKHHFIIIITHLQPPAAPFSPSLISLMVCLDVKRHVYVLLITGHSHFPFHPRNEGKGKVNLKVLTRPIRARQTWKPIDFCLTLQSASHFSLQCRRASKDEHSVPRDDSTSFQESYFAFRTPTEFRCLANKIDNGEC